MLKIFIILIIRHHCDKEISQETGIIINSKVETLVHRHLYLKS